MLELKNINYERDNKKILSNVSLKIDEDCFVAITGPNGSGKSTLAKIIMGIIKPDSGNIYLDGTDITDLDTSKRAKLGIAFAFQQPIRFKGITVYDLLKIANGSNLTRKEACNALSKVGLCAMEYLDRELNNSLSGGELKRIEIATVSLRESRVTIFDEPEAGIDLWSFNNLIQVFREIRSNIKGITIIITHQERILNIADEIVLLKNGEIKATGNKENILPEVYDNKECSINEGGQIYECNR